MEINICHLYSNLLNTYGDYGNILILKYRLLQRNIKVNIFNVSIDDKFEKEKYDIVFLGGGQDFEQTIVAKDLFNKADYIKEYIESEGVFLCVCGGYQFLGKYYKTSDGKTINGLNILDIYTEAPTKRFIGNIIIEDLDTKEKYVGFENHSGKTFLSSSLKPLGKVLYGYGNNGEDGYEGVKYKNTYGTYMHGPLLSKNTNLSDEIIKKSLAKKYSNFEELVKINDSFEIKAKEQILNKYLL